MYVVFIGLVPVAVKNMFLFFLFISEELSVGYNTHYLDILLITREFISHERNVFGR